MNITKKIKALLALVFIAGTVTAIDTDIYMGGGVASGEPPNILFMFDNSANWGAMSSGRPKQEIEHEALFRFLDAIAERVSDPDNTEAIDHNIALMGATHSNSPGGGKPLYYFAPIRKANASSSMVHIREIKTLLYCDDSSLGKNLYEACITALLDPDGDGNVPFNELPDSALASAKLTEVATGEQYATWEEFESWIKTLSDKDQGDIYQGKLPTANRAKYATQMMEGYLWYQGERARAGKADGFNSYDMNAFMPTDRPNYKSPISHYPEDPSAATSRDPNAEYCGRNHIVFMGNGGPDNGENTSAEALLSSIGSSTDILDIRENDKYEANWADEFARYFAKSDVNSTLNGDQHITTHVIDVFDPAEERGTQSELGAHALLASMASAGGGLHVQASTPEEIVAGLLEIVDAVIAVNDVFAASALPVSVNVRGTNLNQVYIGVFRPDADGRPRWNGNMKMYKLGLDNVTGKVFLADADGLEAANTATGFITDTARSFWTHTSNYWQYLDGSVGEGPGANSDNPDGDLVEKGAVAQQLREKLLADFDSRTLYTCRDCTTNSTLDNFDKTISETLLGLENPTPENRDHLIDWARGSNNHWDDFDADRLVDSTIRASVHGDVLHSRPAVINYGNYDDDPDTDDQVYVFYGSNDGWLRAIRGGTDESLFAGGGEELWAFIAPEHWAEVDTLYDNEIMASQDEKPFFIDGVIGSYVEMTGDKASKVIIYLTMRRGGNFVYALDVSNPEVPKYLWRIGNDQTAFSDLGQTWSAPTVGKVKIGDADKAVLVFGLGYDADANDGKVGRETTATEGHGIVMVDAMTGELIWKTGPAGEDSETFKKVEKMNYAVSADLTVIDRDRNGYIDRIYFGDTGGQLWRVDVFDTDRTQWQATRLFQLSNGQKFLSAPDVAASTDATDPFDAVAIVSGDRENPFNTTVKNYIIVLKDYDQRVSTSTASIKYLGDLVNATYTSDIKADVANYGNGFYIELLGSGEKGISKPAIVNSIVYLNTFEPPSITSCSSLGTARSYQFDFMTSRATSDKDGDGDLELDDRISIVDGGGLLPDPVPVMVLINGELVEAIISGTQVEQFPNTILEKRQQTFWFKEVDD